MMAGQEDFEGESSHETDLEAGQVETGRRRDGVSDPMGLTLLVRAFGKISQHSLIQTFLEAGAPAISC